MSQIQTSALSTQWVDGNTIHGADYTNDRSIIVAAINDNYTQMTNLKSGGITSSMLAAGAVTQTAIANGAVGTAQIATGAITSSLLASGAVEQAAIANGAIGTSQIASGAITSGLIANGAVGNAQLASNAVASTNIQGGAVGNSQLATNAVGTSNIQSGAITSSLIASGAVGATQIANGAVGTSQIANGGVETANIASGAVGTLQIASNAVGSGQIANGAVGATQLATGAVGNTQLASNAVATTNLQNGAVTSAKIATGAVTSTQVDGTTVYTASQVDSKLNNATYTKTVQAGTSFPASPYNDGQEFYREDLATLYIYNSTAAAWQPAAGIATPTTPGTVKAGSTVNVASDGTLNASAPVHGPNLTSLNHFTGSLYNTRGTAVTFTRASAANNPETLMNVATGVPAYVTGKWGDKGGALSIWEGTTNLVENSDFETFTSTAQLFNDALTSYTGSSAAPWTVQNGSFTFGASGATCGASNSYASAGNITWKPLVGSGGQNLALTAQATFTQPATVSTNLAGNILLMQDMNNRYEAYITNSTFYVAKFVGGTPTNITSIAQTIAASTAYTITLSLDHTGLLTAKLYSGSGTGGTLLQTLTATDTSLTGGFLIGVGGDAGVIISNASVTAPWADGWQITGDSRVSWALTSTNPISGNYSVSVVGVASGVEGYVQMNDLAISVSASSSYTESVYMSTSNVGNTGAFIHINWYDSTNTFINGVDAGAVSGTTSTQRHTLSITSPSNAAHAQPVFIIDDSGTVTFDAIQLEQKAYATPYLRNDSTSGSATRAGELATLPGTMVNMSGFTIAGHFTAGVDSVKLTNFNALVSFAGVGLTGVYVDPSSTDIYAAWDNNRTANSGLTYKAGDKIFYAWTWDGSNMGLQIGINGNTIVKSVATGCTPTTLSITNLQIGALSNSQQANGSTDDFAIWDEVLTDAQVYSLYAATEPTVDVYQSDAATVTGMAPGASNGLATLGSNGIITATQLPSDLAKTDAANIFTGNQTAPAFIPSGLTGATAASRYAGATTGGAPTTGTFAVGDFVIDQSGTIWICTAAGTPGTWTQLVPLDVHGRIAETLFNPRMRYTLNTTGMTTSVSGSASKTSDQGNMFTASTGTTASSVFYAEQQGQTGLGVDFSMHDVLVMIQFALNVPSGASTSAITAAIVAGTQAYSGGNMGYAEMGVQISNGNILATTGAGAGQSTLQVGTLKAAGNITYGSLAIRQIHNTTTSSYVADVWYNGSYVGQITTNVPQGIFVAGVIPQTGYFSMNLGNGSTNAYNVQLSIGAFEASWSSGVAY